MMQSVPHATVIGVPITDRERPQDVPTGPHAGQDDGRVWAQVCADPDRVYEDDQEPEGKWCERRSVLICVKGQEHIFEGKARLFPPTQSPTMEAALRGLNGGYYEYPEGFCVVYIPPEPKGTAEFVAAVDYTNLVPGQYRLLWTKESQKVAKDSLGIAYEVKQPKETRLPAWTRPAEPAELPGKGVRFEFIAEDRLVYTVFTRTPFGMNFAIKERGLEVTRVEPGSHAQELGIQAGWLINSAGGMCFKGWSFPEIVSFLKAQASSACASGG